MYGKKTTGKSPTTKKTNPIESIAEAPNETEGLTKSPGVSHTALAEISKSNQGLANMSETNMWQVQCRGLSERLKALLERGLWTDCELLVGKTPATFRAHRVVLASASPVLANMLYGDQTSTQSTLAIPEIEPDIFQLVLDYIYTDKVTILSSVVGCKLYEAANFLNLPQLQAECMQYLLKNVNHESVIIVYEFADKFNDCELKAKCLEIMVDKIDLVLSGEGIVAAQIETLEKIFSLPYLNISSELELYKAAERWVRSHVNQPRLSRLSTSSQKLESSTVNFEDANKEMDPKILIQKALQQIRFLTLTPEEYEKNDMSYLLSEAELLAILLNLNSRETYKPMPVGFSTIREPRNQQPAAKTFVDTAISIYPGSKQTRRIIVRLDQLYNFVTTFDFELGTIDANKILWEFKISRIERNDCGYCRTSGEGLNEFPFYVYNCEISLNCYWNCKNCTVCSFDGAVEMSILRWYKDISQFHWTDRHHFRIAGLRDAEENKFVIKDLLDWNEILDPSNGYIKNNAITIEVRITCETPIMKKIVCFGST